MRVLTGLPVASLALFGACGGSGAGPAQAASARTVAAMLPADTVVYARVASLDALVASARVATVAFGGPAQSVDREQMLAGLGAMAGDTRQIDGGRAIGVALVAPKGVRPTPIVFVPVLDGARYAASLRDSGLEAVVEGGYAVLPIGGKYTKPAAPSTFADAMPAGLLAVRVDVAKASANLGVLINSGLDVFQRQMAKEMGAAGSGVDGEAIAEQYVGFAKALLAAGNTMDLVVDETGGRASITATLAAKAGSELDGWSSAPVDMTAFAGKVTGRAAGNVVAVADWAKVWPKLEPAMIGFFEIYPPELRTKMQGLMQSYRSLYDRMGPIVVGDIDVADGLRATMHIAPPDGKAMLAEFEALARRPEVADFGITVTPGKTIDGEGLSMREGQLRFDVERMAKLAGDEAKAPAATKQVADFMRSLFGSDSMPMRLAVAGGRGVFELGKLAADPAQELAPATGGWPAPLQSAVAMVRDCNPLFIERIDFAAMMRGLGPLVAPGGRGMPPIPADAKADFVVGGGVRGAEWRAFLIIDLAGFGAMTKAMTPR